MTRDDEKAAGTEESATPRGERAAGGAKMDEEYADAARLRSRGETGSGKEARTVIEDEEVPDEPVIEAQTSLPDPGPSRPGRVASRSRDASPPGAPGDDSPADAALADEAFLWRRSHGRRPGDIEDEEVEEDPVVEANTPLPDEGLDELHALGRRSLAEVGRWLIDRARGGYPVFTAIAKEEEERRKAAEGEPLRDLPVDVDPHDLRRARWGLVATPATFRRLEAQLRPLLEQRQTQMEEPGPIEPLFFDHPQTAASFLLRRGETAGTIRPEIVPYYLLIVGGPEEIPWEFQYGLADDHAVGRIAFDDAADYGRYARAVVAAERDGSKLPRQTMIFSVENPGDDATTLLGRYLTTPLFRDLSGYVPGWEIRLQRGAQASRDHLERLLAEGARAPGLLLVSSHGQLVRREEWGDEMQRRFQGAVMCQRNGGSRRFSAFDLAAKADLLGQIAFLFACYGAGTPRYDNYPASDDPETAFRDSYREIAPRPFVAQLPQALLRRGTLGVVGHVDRGWALSFVWTVGDRMLSSVGSLEDSLKRLLLGDRIGHALRPLQRRGAALSSRIARTLDSIRQGSTVDPEYFAEQWIIHNDARNVVLLGDPAVYLLGRPTGGSLLRLPEPLAGELRRRAADRGVSVEECLSEAVEQWLGRPPGSL